MKRIVFRVIPAGPRKWLIDGGPFAATEREYATKAAAVGVAAAKGRALRDAGHLAQLMIHGAKGQFQDERTYGRDPRRSKG